MSIANLLVDNNYSIHCGSVNVNNIVCDTVTCDTVTCNTITSNTINSDIVNADNIEASGLTIESVTFDQSNPITIIAQSSGGTNPNIEIPRTSIDPDIFITANSDQNIVGNKIFNTVCPSSTIAPTVGDHLCNKTYVDSVAGGGGGSKAFLIARKTSENTVNNTTLTLASTMYSATLTTITQSYAFSSSDLSITIGTSGIVNFNNTSGSAKNVMILLDFGFWTNATAPQTLLMRWSHNTGVTWKFFYSSSITSIYQKEMWIQYYSIPAGSTNTQIQLQNSTGAGVVFSITSLQLSVQEL